MKKFKSLGCCILMLLFVGTCYAKEKSDSLLNENPGICNIEEFHKVLKNDDIITVTFGRDVVLDEIISIPQHVVCFLCDNTRFTKPVKILGGFGKSDALTISKAKFENDIYSDAVAYFKECCFDGCKFILSGYLNTREMQKNIGIIGCYGNNLSFVIDKDLYDNRWKVDCLKVDATTIKKIRDISYFHPWLEEHSEENEYKVPPFTVYGNTFNYYLQKINRKKTNAQKDLMGISLGERVESINKDYEDCLNKIDFNDSDMSKEVLLDVIDNMLESHFRLLMTIKETNTEKNLTNDDFINWASEALSELIPNELMRKQIVRTSFFSKTKCGLLSIASPVVCWGTEENSRKFFKNLNLAGNLVWFNEKPNNFLEWRNVVINRERGLLQLSKITSKLLQPKENAAFKKKINDMINLRKAMEPILQIIYFDIPIQYFLSGAYVNIESIIKADGRWLKDVWVYKRDVSPKDMSQITNIVRDVAPVYKMTKVCKLYSTNDIRTLFIKQLKDYLKKEEYDSFSTILATDPDWLRDKKNLSEFFNSFVGEVVDK